MQPAAEDRDRFLRVLLDELGDALDRRGLHLALDAGDVDLLLDVGTGQRQRLALARALITAGDPDGAGAYLAELAAADPGDWRIAWHNGLRELASGRPDAARAASSM